MSADAVTDVSKSVPPNDSGSDSFDRFCYQAFIALPYCLRCASGDEVTAIYLEHFEDIVIQTPSRWHFLQVKTRDPGRGPWHLTDMLGSGGAFRSLLRTFRALPNCELTLEAHLEGEIATGDPLNAFEERTRDQTVIDARAEYCRNKLEASGTEFASFYPKLRVIANRPPREFVDDLALMTLQKAAPGAALPIVAAVLDRVLSAIYDRMRAKGARDVHKRLVLGETSTTSLIASKTLSQVELNVLLQPLSIRSMGSILLRCVGPPYRQRLYPSDRRTTGLGISDDRYWHGLGREHSFGCILANDRRACQATAPPFRSLWQHPQGLHLRQLPRSHGYFVGYSHLKLQINSVSLVGADRDIALSEGLNVIVGPIASGKSSVLQICRGLLGGKLETALPEIKATTEAISGIITIATERYSILRKWVTTASAPVEISGSQFADRLPALQPLANQPLTYARWLMNRLDLPVIEVPRAPTQIESDSTPVSLTDFLLFCIIEQDDIDTNVFGHKDTFKNIKRRYVFEIIYGSYGAEMAQLQEALREVSSRIRALQADTAVLERVLKETRWANRGDLERDLLQATSLSNALGQQAVTLANRAREVGSVGISRSAVLEVEREISEARDRRLKASASVERLEELRGQLITQRQRLIRSIVAGDALVDFDFKVCPRCGAEVETARATAPTCGLCLQAAPMPEVTRRDLIVELERVEDQIGETDELVTRQRAAAREVEGQVTDLGERRDQLAVQLDRVTAEYVSDAAELIAQVARDRARAEERVTSLRDYLGLFQRLDTTAGELDGLREQRRSLQGQLEAEESRRSVSRLRLDTLNQKFRDILSRLHAPEIGDASLSYIDAVNYMPIVGGRSFDNLSSQGLKVLVNIAHVMPHHETAIELGLPLPDIVIIDGPTSNIGRDGENLERVKIIYAYLIDASRRFGDRMQIIVADNDIPEIAEEFVRLRLTDEDRLIPAAILAASQSPRLQL